MKKLKILTLVFLTLTVVFGSCKKDKEDDNNNVAIVGKWKKTKEVETEYHNGAKGDVYTDTKFGSDDYIEYKSNGTYVVGDDFMTLNYKINGSKISYTAGSLELLEETLISVSSTELVLEETDDDGDGDKSVIVRTYSKM